jgi:PAS domain S-box-containing protein
VTLEDGVFLEANDAFWTLAGLAPEQTLGRSAVELDLWEHPEDRRKFVRDLLEQGSLADVEVNFSGGGNPPRSSLGYYELITVRGRLCILCMFYDISEQRRAQRDLMKSETRMRAIIASIPDMIFEISKDGAFLDFMASAGVNPALPPDQFIGRNIAEIFPGTIAEQTLFALERAIATGQVHSFEYDLPSGDEIQSYEARVAAVTPESAIIMVRNISQRKWVEIEREKLIEELELKNAELERFTYTVSHDLKSPVITIRGFLGFLEQDARSGNLTRLHADIKRISDATDKMQTLLNELLDLSRIGRLVNPPSLTPFKEIVEEALSLTQGRLQANRVRVHVQDEMGSVFVDRQRMVEALQNLIDNAAKFTREDAMIEIRQDGMDGNMPVFFVRDNGVGIDPAHHERIFGLFNKLDPDSEGTGIGLALVRRIIEVHKGRIWIESEPGKGSTFFFSLPLRDPNPES